MRSIPTLRSAAQGSTRATLAESGHKNPRRDAADDAGRARRRKGRDQGFHEISVDAETEAILGASILGVGGDEAIHWVLDIIYAKAPYQVLQHAVHIHPTVSELIPTLLSELGPAS